MSGLWCLYNSYSGQRFDALTFDEARAILMTSPEENWSEWYCWHELWTQWQSVSLVPELLEPIRRTMSAFAPAAPQVVVRPNTGTTRIDNHTFTEFDFTSTEEDNSNVEFINREHPRVKRQYRVRIKVDQRVFETHTLNISEGGMLLAKPLPDWVVGYCRVTVIRSATHMIDLTCAVVENQDPKQRVRLQVIEDSATSIRHFKKWLAA